MPIPSINLAIVDDHTLFRKSLSNYLSAQNSFKVVLQCPGIPELMSKLKDYYVDILLMDIYMPAINGNEAVDMIRKQYPELKILVLSMCSDMNLLSDILDTSVYGVVSKADEPEELVRAITAVAEHRIYRNKLFTDLMYWTKQKNAGTGNTNDDILLSEREKAILQFMWEEKTNREIADQLCLSVRSIEKIRQDMKEKVGARSTIGLLKYAINKKVIGINCWQPTISKRENGCYS